MAIAGERPLAQEASARDFEELYRRYADDANRVAWSVTRNPHDAADAVAEAFTRVFTAMRAGREIDEVRAYLLTAVRNAAIDLHRASGREHPDDEIELSALEAPPDEDVVAVEDADLVTTAFSGLPPRWQSVLWLTQVEQVGSTEAAAQLGMSTNALGQLAFRARAGLRQRYVQAHLRAVGDGPCRPTVERLGAHALGALPPGEAAQVEEHLAECAECRNRLDELSDVSATLRHALVPLPLGLALARIQSRLDLGSAEPTASILDRALDPMGSWQRVAAGVAAGVLFLGGLVALFEPDGGGGPGLPPFAGGRTDQTLDDGPPVEPSVLGARRRNDEGGAGERRRAAGALNAVSRVIDAPGRPGPAGGGEPPSPSPPTPSPPPPDPFQIVVRVDQDPAPTVVAVGLGEGGCTGVRIGLIVVGCSVPVAPPDLSIAIPELLPLS